MIPVKLLSTELFQSLDKLERLIVFAMYARADKSGSTRHFASIKQIAIDTGLCINTVKDRLKTINAKGGFKSRSRAFNNVNKFQLLSADEIDVLPVAKEKKRKQSYSKPRGFMAKSRSSHDPNQGSPHESNPLPSHDPNLGSSHEPLTDLQICTDNNRYKTKKVDDKKINQNKVFINSESLDETLISTCLICEPNQEKSIVDNIHLPLINKPVAEKDTPIPVNSAPAPSPLLEYNEFGEIDPRCLCVGLKAGLDPLVRQMSFDEYKKAAEYLVKRICEDEEIKLELVEASGDYYRTELQMEDIPIDPNTGYRVGEFKRVETAIREYVCRHLNWIKRNDNPSIRCLDLFTLISRKFMEESQNRVPVNDKLPF